MGVAKRHLEERTVPENVYLDGFSVEGYRSFGRPAFFAPHR